jgi:mannose-1-phosphate guanylyltransferase
LVFAAAGHAHGGAYARLAWASTPNRKSVPTVTKDVAKVVRKSSPEISSRKRKSTEVGEPIGRKTAAAVKW